jgi:hypothetical protein
LKILVLEDSGVRVKFFIERFGHYDLTITENAYTAIEYLKRNKYDYIFLDNDLGPDDGEGRDVAKFLEANTANANYNTIVIVHSWNAVATKDIQARLPKVVTAPYNTENFFSLRLDIER